MNTERFDLVVIGTGTAASVAASRCRAAGWSVAVVDHRPYGGTCALRGCDPKKVLVGAAEALDAVKSLDGKGVESGQCRIEWPALMRFKRSFTGPVPEAKQQSFAKQGITCLHGKARFTGHARIEVGGRCVEAHRVLIAAGAEPVSLPIEGTEHLLPSAEFLELDALPRRILFVGGGYIAFEFAHIAARAGAEVSVLQRGSCPLSRFDPDLVKLLVARTRQLGVRVELEHEVISVIRERGSLVVKARGPRGEVTFPVDIAVHSAGRAPAVDDLDLEAAAIAHDDRRIRINEFLQSVSNPIVFVAGDAAGTGYPLTPVAALEGRAAAANLLEGNHATVDYSAIPCAVFSIPPLARVGLLEAEAREQGLEVRVHYKSTPDWYTARRVGEPCYAHKTLVEEGSGRLLGAHVVGPDASEVINLFAFALRRGLGFDELRETVFAYPTAASDIASMF